MNTHPFFSNQNGNVSVVLAVCITMVGMMVGTALDLSRLTSADQKLQDALDAATLLAAKSTGDSPKVDANIFLNEMVNDLTIFDLSSDFQFDGNQVIGTARAELNLVFGGLLGKDTSSIGARTVVNVPSEGPCIIVLNESRFSSLLLNTGAHIDASHCEVHVHSDTTQSVTVNSGARLESKKICVAGSAYLNTGGVVEGLEPDCTPDGDPYAGRVPVPNSTSCDYPTANYSSSQTQLQPGVYCGWHNFQGVGSQIDLAPGLYVLRDGGWNVNEGAVSGENVTFYFADESKINFNSGIDVSFSAPQTGAYAGILMSEVLGLPNTPLNLNDANGYDFKGAIHLPSRDLTLNSGTNVASKNLTIVSDTLTVNNVNLSPGDPNGDGGDTTQIYISE